jgi:hypothetical protein
MLINRHTDFGLDKDKVMGDGMVAGFGKSMAEKSVCILKILP